MGFYIALILHAIQVDYCKKVNAKFKQKNSSTLKTRQFKLLLLKKQGLLK